MRIQLSSFTDKTLTSMKQFYATIPQTERELEIVLDTPDILRNPLDALAYLPRHIVAVTLSGRYTTVTTSYQRQTGTRFQAGNGEIPIYRTEWRHARDVNSTLKPFVEALPGSISSLKLAFTLEGTRYLINSNVVDALGEIVKIIPATVTHFDMNEVELDDPSGQFRILQCLPTTVTDISVGPLGLREQRSRRSLLSAMHRNVETLTLSNNYLSQGVSRSWPQFFQGLPDNLQILALANNNLGQRNHSDLKAMLSGLPERLVTLKLNRNNLSRFYGKQIADVLSGHPNGVEELDLGENGLLLMAVDELDMALSGLQPRVTRLRLCESNLTTLQLEQVIERLQVTPAHIDTLDFSDCNLFGFSVDDFCTLLQAIPRTIRTLNLSNNVSKVRYYDEWAQLLAGVPRHISTVLLEKNNFGCLDAAGLTEIFASCPAHIKRLGLSHNGFNTLMVSQLEQRLSVLPDVILDFSKDNPRQTRALMPSSSLSTSHFGLFKTHVVTKKQHQFAQYMLTLMQLMNAKQQLNLDLTNHILSFILDDVSKGMLQRLNARIIAQTRPEIVTARVLDETIITVNKRLYLAERTQSTVMDFSRCGLNRIDDVDLLQQVFEMVPEDTSSLSLAGNGFGQDDDTLATLIDALDSIPEHIIHLDLSHNGFELFNGEQLQALFVNLPLTVRTITIGESKPLSPATHIAVRYWPRSYETLMAPTVDLLQQARALLDDYIKGDSTFWRLFFLHWARHHIEEVVRLVMRIDKGLITNTQDLLGELALIEPVNKVGSLSRRISFLTSKKSLPAPAIEQSLESSSPALEFDLPLEVEMTAWSYS